MSLGLAEGDGVQSVADVLRRAPLAETVLEVPGASVNVRAMRCGPGLVGVCGPPASIKLLPRTISPSVVEEDASKCAASSSVVILSGHVRDLGADIVPPSVAAAAPTERGSDIGDDEAATDDEDDDDNDVDDDDDDELNTNNGGGTFRSYFSLASKGGRSGPIRVGRYRCNRSGRWCDAVEKRIDIRRGGNLCLIRTMKNGVVRDLSGNQTRVNNRPLPSCHPPSNLAVLRDMAEDIRHVIRILHFEPRGKKLVVYSPWYPAGSIHEAVRWCGVSRFSLAERAGILCGAWSGLWWLNNEARMLHYDIKPANVLVDRCNGKWIGVLGDVDDAVNMDGFALGGADVKSTPCYGAPHQHGDPRRDQVALLVTTGEFLSGINWYHLSCRFLRNAGLTDREQRLWGYATDGRSGMPHAWKHWIHGVYAAYATDIRRNFRLPWVDGSEASTAAAAMKLIIMSMLETLDAAPESWDYATVHQRITESLSVCAHLPVQQQQRQPPSAKRPATVDPESVPPPKCSRSECGEA